MSASCDLQFRYYGPCQINRGKDNEKKQRAKLYEK